MFVQGLRGRFEKYLLFLCTETTIMKEIRKTTLRCKSMICRF